MVVMRSTLAVTSTLLVLVTTSGAALAQIRPGPISAAPAHADELDMIGGRMFRNQAVVRVGGYETEGGSGAGPATAFVAFASTGASVQSMQAAVLLDPADDARIPGVSFFGESPFIASWLNANVPLPGKSWLALEADMGSGVPGGATDIVFVVERAPGALIADIEVEVLQSSIATGRLDPVTGFPDTEGLFVLPVGDNCGPVVSYCTAGVSTNGCQPTIRGVGLPSASSGGGFDLVVEGVEGQRQGILFYGINGRSASPWGTGTSMLCVKAPTQRTTAQGSGGTAGACDGAFVLDWNQFVASTPGVLGAPFGSGDTVWAQGWYRDPPAPKTTSLTGGLEFTLCP